MATTDETAPVAEGGTQNDEEYLYGDAGKVEEDNTAGETAAPEGSAADPNTEGGTTETAGEGDINAEEEGEGEEESSEDEFKVVLAPTDQTGSRQQKGIITSGPLRISQKRGYVRPGLPSIAKAKTSGPGGDPFSLNTGIKSTQKDIFELEIENLEEKGWRKPGADLTDYFNYGFQEDTWRMYCVKQQKLREELLMQSKIEVHVSKSNDQGGGRERTSRWAPQPRPDQQAPGWNDRRDSGAQDDRRDEGRHRDPRGEAPREGTPPERPARRRDDDRRRQRSRSRERDSGDRRDRRR